MGITSSPKFIVNITHTLKCFCKCDACFNTGMENPKLCCKCEFALNTSFVTVFVFNTVCAFCPLSLYGLSVYCVYTEVKECRQDLHLGSFSKI